MSEDSAKARIKIIKPRIPKFCICPFCNTKQLFRKKKEHWKTVKEINIDGPVLPKVQIVYAKCLNPNCERASFPLPISLRWTPLSRHEFAIFKMPLRSHCFEYQYQSTPQLVFCNSVTGAVSPDCRRRYSYQYPAWLH